MASSIITFISFSVLAALVTAILIRKRSKSPQKLPPSPWKLPIIGHLHHLAGGAPPHHALRNLAQKYGGLVYLQLGGLSTILVSSPRYAKEVMKTHDLTFADRAGFVASKILFYESAGMGAAPYGEHWRQMRKICTTELLTVQRVRSFGWIRQEEGLHLINSIRDAIGTPTPINLRKKLEEYTVAMFLRAAFGSISDDDRKALVEPIKEALSLSATLDIADIFPSLKILNRFSSVKKRAMSIQSCVDRALDSIIDQHLARSSDGPSDHQDLIDVLLRVKQSGDLQIPITNTHIKAVLFDMFGGGTETSSTAVEWAMAEIIRHPEVMAKVQSEIRIAIGTKKTVEEADIQHLSYLKLVVKETLRLHPPAPLLPPRENRQHTEIDGYSIPNKTGVIINIWAIGRDPESWEDPESFKPERFDNSGRDFTGSDFEYIPFGAGRRMCPGISFGLANVYLPLALLLYHFDWQLPSGLNPKDLDMSERVGMNAARASNLLLLPQLYEPSV